MKGDRIMYSRVNIKERAKAVLRANYWPLVGFFLIAIILTGGNSSLTPNFRIDVKDLDHNLFSKEMIESLRKVAIGASALGILYKAFVGNVVSVGGARLGLCAYRGERPQFLDIFYGFRNKRRYWRTVATMALTFIFVALGMLLFVVPGIIIGLGLSQVRYLLAQDVDSSPMEIVKLSWNIMRGNKGDYFVFHLSFFGWYLLTGLTFGVLGVFYTNPYTAVAMAGYYDNLIASSEE